MKTDAFLACPTVAEAMEWILQNMGEINVSTRQKNRLAIFPLGQVNDQAIVYRFVRDYLRLWQEHNVPKKSQQQATDTPAQ